jgi:hypothetical protein
LKEPSNAKADPITPYLTAISIVAIAGLLPMLGGAIALRNGAQFHEELIGVFMLMTFVIVGMVEVFLCASYRASPKLLRSARLLRHQNKRGGPASFVRPSCARLRNRFVVSLKTRLALWNILAVGLRAN